MIFTHYVMLSDPIRMKALQRAIESVVKPGDVVLDLGGGTGVLAMLALRAGAGRAVIVERSPVIRHARRLAEANGLSDRIEFFECDWADVRLEERADVLLTETLGPFGVDENILGAVRHARENLLRPGARMMPRSMDLFIAPVHSPETYRQIAFWDERPAGLDFSPMRAVAECSVISERFFGANLIASPAKVASYDLAGGTLADFSAEVEFPAGRAGDAHGFAGWFSAELSPDISISTGPADSPTHWKQSFFPLHEPFALLPGDSIKLRISSMTAPAGVAYHWFAQHIRKNAAIGKSNHSTVLSIETKPMLK